MKTLKKGVTLKPLRFFHYSGKLLLINQLMTWSDFDASMYCGVTLSLLDLFDVSDWSMLIIVEIGFDFSLCLNITACSCLDSLCKHYSHTESIDALNTTLWLKLTDWAEVLTHHVYFKIDKRKFFFLNGSFILVSYSS